MANNQLGIPDDVWASFTEDEKKEQLAKLARTNQQAHTATGYVKPKDYAGFKQPETPLPTNPWTWDAKDRKDASDTFSMLWKGKYYFDKSMKEFGKPVNYEKAKGQEKFGLHPWDYAPEKWYNKDLRTSRMMLKNGVEQGLLVWDEQGWDKNGKATYAHVFRMIPKYDPKTQTQTWVKEMKPVAVVMPNGRVIPTYIPMKDIVNAAQPLFGGLRAIEKAYLWITGGLPDKYGDQSPEERVKTFNDFFGFVPDKDYGDFNKKADPLPEQPYAWDALYNPNNKKWTQYYKDFPYQTYKGLTPRQRAINKAGTEQSYIPGGVVGKAVKTISSIPELLYNKFGTAENGYGGLDRWKTQRAQEEPEQQPQTPINPQDMTPGELEQYNKYVENMGWPRLLAEVGTGAALSFVPGAGLAYFMPDILTGALRDPAKPTPIAMGEGVGTGVALGAASKLAGVGSSVAKTTEAGFRPTVAQRGVDWAKRAALNTGALTGVDLAAGNEVTPESVAQTALTMGGFGAAHAFGDIGRPVTPQSRPMFQGEKGAETFNEVTRAAIEGKGTKSTEEIVKDLVVNGAVDPKRYKAKDIINAVEDIQKASDIAANGPYYAEPAPPPTLPQQIFDYPISLNRPAPWQFTRNEPPIITPPPPPPEAPLSGPPTVEPQTGAPTGGTSSGGAATAAPAGEQPRTSDIVNDIAAKYGFKMPQKPAETQAGGSAVQPDVTPMPLTEQTIRATTKVAEENKDLSKKTEQQFLDEDLPVIVNNTGISNPVAATDTYTKMTTQRIDPETGISIKGSYGDDRIMNEIIDKNLLTPDKPNTEATIALGTKAGQLWDRIYNSEQLADLPVTQRILATTKIMPQLVGKPMAETPAEAFNSVIGYFTKKQTATADKQIETGFNYFQSEGGKDALLNGQGLPKPKTTLGKTAAEPKKEPEGQKVTTPTGEETNFPGGEATEARAAETTPRETTVTNMPTEEDIAAVRAIQEQQARDAEFARIQAELELQQATKTQEIPGNYNPYSLIGEEQNVPVYNKPGITVEADRYVPDVVTAPPDVKNTTVGRPEAYKKAEKPVSPEVEAENKRNLTIYQGAVGEIGLNEKEVHPPNLEGTLNVGTADFLQPNKQGGIGLDRAVNSGEPYVVVTTTYKNDKGEEVKEIVSILKVNKDGKYEPFVAGVDEQGNKVTLGGVPKVLIGKSVPTGVQEYWESGTKKKSVDVTTRTTPNVETKPNPEKMAKIIADKEAERKKKSIGGNAYVKLNKGKGKEVTQKEEEKGEKKVVAKKETEEKKTEQKPDRTFQGMAKESDIKQNRMKPVTDTKKGTVVYKKLTGEARVIVSAKDDLVVTVSPENYQDGKILKPEFDKNSIISFTSEPPPKKPKGGHVSLEQEAANAAKEDMEREGINLKGSLKVGAGGLLNSDLAKKLTSGGGGKTSKSSGSDKGGGGGGGQITTTNIPGAYGERKPTPGAIKVGDKVRIEGSGQTKFTVESERTDKDGVHYYKLSDVKTDDKTGETSKVVLPGEYPETDLSTTKKPRKEKTKETVTIVTPGEQAKKIAEETADKKKVETEEAPSGDIAEKIKTELKNFDKIYSLPPWILNDFLWGSLWLLAPDDWGAWKNLLLLPIVAGHGVGPLRNIRQRKLEKLFLQSGDVTTNPTALKTNNDGVTLKAWNSPLVVEFVKNNPNDYNGAIKVAKEVQKNINDAMNFKPVSPNVQTNPLAEEFRHDLREIEREVGRRVRPLRKQVNQIVAWKDKDEYAVIGASRDIQKEVYNRQAEYQILKGKLSEDLKPLLDSKQIKPSEATELRKALEAQFKDDVKKIIGEPNVRKALKKRGGKDAEIDELYKKYKFYRKYLDDLTGLTFDTNFASAYNITFMQFDEVAKKAKEATDKYVDELKTIKDATIALRKLRKEAEKLFNKTGEQKYKEAIKEIDRALDDAKNKKKLLKDQANVLNMQINKALNPDKNGQTGRDRAIQQTQELNWTPNRYVFGGGEHMFIVRQQTVNPETGKPGYGVVSHWEADTKAYGYTTSQGKAMAEGLKYISGMGYRPYPDIANMFVRTSPETGRNEYVTIEYKHAPTQEVKRRSMRSYPDIISGLLTTLAPYMRAIKEKEKFDQKDLESLKQEIRDALGEVPEDWVEGDIVQSLNQIREVAGNMKQISDAEAIYGLLIGAKARIKSMNQNHNYDLVTFPTKIGEQGTADGIIEQNTLDAQVNKAIQANTIANIRAKFDAKVYQNNLTDTPFSRWLGKTKEAYQNESPISAVVVRPTNRNTGAQMTYDIPKYIQRYGLIPLIGRVFWGNLGSPIKNELFGAMAYGVNYLAEGGGLWHLGGDYLRMLPTSLVNVARTIGPAVRNSFEGLHRTIDRVNREEGTSFESRLQNNDPPKIYKDADKQKAFEDAWIGGQFDPNSTRIDANQNKKMIGPVPFDIDNALNNALLLMRATEFDIKMKSWNGGWDLATSLKSPKDFASMEEYNRWRQNFATDMVAATSGYYEKGDLSSHMQFLTQTSFRRLFSTFLKPADLQFTDSAIKLMDICRKYDAPKAFAYIATGVVVALTVSGIKNSPVALLGPILNYADKVFGDNGLVLDETFTESIYNKTIDLLTKIGLSDNAARWLVDGAVDGYMSQITGVNISPSFLPPFTTEPFAWSTAKSDWAALVQLGEAPMKSTMRLAGPGARRLINGARWLYEGQFMVDTPAGDLPTGIPFGPMDFIKMQFGNNMDMVRAQSDIFDGGKQDFSTESARYEALGDLFKRGFGNKVGNEMLKRYYKAGLSDGYSEAWRITNQATRLYHNRYEESYAMNLDKWDATWEKMKDLYSVLQSGDRAAFEKQLENYSKGDDALVILNPAKRRYTSKDMQAIQDAYKSVQDDMVELYQNYSIRKALELYYNVPDGSRVNLTVDQLEKLAWQKAIVKFKDKVKSLFKELE